MCPSAVSPVSPMLVFHLLGISDIDKRIFGPPPSALGKLLRRLLPFLGPRTEKLKISAKRPPSSRKQAQEPYLDNQFPLKEL